jgi:hypothetical protein
METVQIAAIVVRTEKHIRVISIPFNAVRGEWTCGSSAF